MQITIKNNDAYNTLILLNFKYLFIYCKKDIAIGIDVVYNDYIETELLLIPLPLFLHFIDQSY